MTKCNDRIPVATNKVAVSRGTHIRIARLERRLLPPRPDEMVVSCLSLDILSPLTLLAQFLQRLPQPASFCDEGCVLLNDALIARLELMVRLCQGRNVPFLLINHPLKAPPLSVAIRMGTQSPGEGVCRGGELGFANQRLRQITIDSELERLAWPSHEWGIRHPTSLT